MVLCVFAWQPNDHCCLIRLAPSFRLVPHSASSNLKFALGGTDFALKRSFRLDFFGVRSGIVHFWKKQLHTTAWTECLYRQGKCDCQFQTGTLTKGTLSVLSNQSPARGIQ